jgi:triphosphoribosyl-dephospho-CoA synthase
MLAVHHIAIAENLATKAVKALSDEALLTPKPGLVDAADSGSHTDMSLDLMLKSAQALEGTFRDIALVSYLHPVNQELREKIALIGRQGEKDMLAATNGVNTHKGAIWALGLLTSAKAAFPEEHNPLRILEIAGEIASFNDRFLPKCYTHGQAVKKKYTVIGAAEEAQLGFPSIRKAALPTLLNARAEGKSENEARIESLVSLMAFVDDTCILHRGNWSELVEIKRMARVFLECNGFGTQRGRKIFYRLSEFCQSKQLSPGGSADLLAATLFLVS